MNTPPGRPAEIFADLSYGRDSKGLAAPRRIAERDHFMATDRLSVFGQFLKHVESGKRRRRRRRGIAPPREGEMALFLSRWLRAPHRIGAVAPASRYLARAMARLVDNSRAEPVIELG